MHSIPLSAESLFSIGGLNITNAVLSTWITLVVVTVFGLIVRHGLKNEYKGWTGGVAVIFENIIVIFEDILGWSATKKLLPLLGTFFIFILIANWIGLVPGFGSIFVGNSHGESVPLLRAANTDINTTLALAIISVTAIQIWGLSQQSFHYLQKFFNLSGPWYLKPINLFVGLLEIVSEGARILSFGFRLFGNVFAGEVLLSVVFGLVPLLVPGVFYGLELFVGFIQAFVFVMLSAVFFKMAGEGHAEEH